MTGKKDKCLTELSSAPGSNALSLRPAPVHRKDTQERDKTSIILCALSFMTLYKKNLFYKAEKSRKR